MPSSRDLSDWVDAWLEFTENSEPAHTFRLWTAVSVVAAALQRKCHLPWGSLTFYPNMYVVLVAPSGQRKGTAMDPGLDMLRDLKIKLAAEAITREALIRELKNSNNTVVHPETGTMELHASLTIYAQELTVFLGYHNHQLMSDLTDWYDCRKRWTYRTKHMGTDEIIGVWVNLFGGTTPELIQTSMPLDAIGGGLTSRMIFVYEQKKGKMVEVPFLTEEELELRQRLLFDLEKIHMLKGEFKVTKEFVRLWVDWYRAQEGNPPFQDRRFAGYFERRPTHVMKLSMILNASRTDSMIIDRQDLERAVKVLKLTERKMRLVFSGVGKSNMAETLSRVMTEIGIRGETTFTELMSKFYNDADKWTMTKIIETLESMKFIDCVYTGTETKIKKSERKNSPFAHTVNIEDEGNQDNEGGEK